MIEARKLLTLSLMTACCFGTLFGAEQVRLKLADRRVDVFVGQRIFTTFYFDPSVAKPYMFPLRSAQGTIVTRGFPMDQSIPGEDQDEPHQRALYFAHGDLNGYDFWGEADFPRWSRHPASRFGRTVFRKLGELRDGPDSGTLQAEFDLLSADGSPIAAETQAYTFSGDE